MGWYFMKNAYISFVYFNSVSDLDFTYYVWTEIQILC